MVTEKRLIDANEPIAAFKRHAKEHPNATWSAFGIEEVLNACSTVDAVEVVHGRWRWCGSDRWNDAYQCSNCGKIAMNDSNYCPNCGAKMAGE